MCVWDRSSRMLSFIAKDQNFSFVFVKVVSRSIRMKYECNIRKRQRLDILVVQRSVNDNFVKIGDGIFIRYHSYFPSRLIFLSVADAVDFGAGQMFIAG